LSILLVNEIDDLKKKMVQLSTMVEEAVYTSVKSITERDLELAQKIIEQDIEIDRMEVEVEEECLKILALHQPVASDLRFIVAVLKIDNDLERIADLAVNIAESTSYLCARAPISAPFDLPSMSQKVKVMLRKAIDALINLESDLAEEVLELDDEIDEINRAMYDQVEQEIKNSPAHTASLISLATTSRHLERIGDHATNIAEDVIYMIEGKIVRHKKYGS
jgi:phosphate transport system protein